MKGLNRIRPQFFTGRKAANISLDMERHKNKITLLVAEMNVIDKENRKLKSMLKRMSIKYNDLQKQVMSLVEQRNGKDVDASQIINPDHRGDDVSYARYSSGAVAPQYHQFFECHEPGWETEKKIAKFVDYQPLSSKKRTVNYLEWAQIENRINSCLNDSPSPRSHKKSPNKKHHALSRRSAATPRKTLSMRTTSEASVVDDGYQWRKYGRKKTKGNPLPRSYYKCAWAPGCPVKKKVQRSAEDPTIVIITYEGDHTHSLTPLVMDAMHSGLSKMLTGEGTNTENLVADNQLIPCIASISTSSPFPTIALDLTDDLTNSGSQCLHLATGSFQPLTSLPNNMGPGLDHSSIVQDYVASVKVDPNFNAALAGAIAGSLLCSGGPFQLGMPKCSPKTQCRDGSTQETFV